MERKRYGDPEESAGPEEHRSENQNESQEELPMRPDVNKPVENPRLTALFAERRQADAAQRDAINEKIAREIALNAWLLAVIQMNPVPEGNNGQGGKITLEEKTTISFPILSSADGKQYLPVFTDWNELRKWPQYANQHVRTMILSFDDIAAVAKSGVAVNPFSDDFRLSREMIVHMKERRDLETKGSAEVRMNKGTTVHIGEPADFPDKMAEAIREYARGVAEINAIWLKLMVRNGEQSYLLVVDASGEWNAVWKGIADAAMPYRRQKIYIDFVPLADSFGKSAATGEPIYRR